MGGYPPGAEYDPNAPYNEQPSLEERFGDDADEIIDGELNEVLNENFVDWVLNASDEVWQEIITHLQKDVNIAHLYREYRFKEAVEEAANDYLSRYEI